jgi:ribose transport system permease protein
MQATHEATRPLGAIARNFLSKYVLIVVLLTCIAVFTAIQPVFMSYANLRNILMQNSYAIVAVCGIAMIMISGGTDLSLSYEMALSSIFMAASMMWWGLPIPVAIVIGVIVAVLLSGLNGLLSVRLKIHSMMVTLATMTIYSGIAFIITDSKTIYDLPEDFKFLGQGLIGGAVPVPVVVMVVVVAVSWFLLGRTYLGRFTYAVGSNAEASRLAGLDVGVLKVLIFAIGGIMIGIASVLLLGRAGSASATMAMGAEFNAITAAVLGGIALKGGEGKLWGAVVGVLILGVLANGMQLIGLGQYPQYIAKGVILLAAIGFDTYQKSKR